MKKILVVVALMLVSLANAQKGTVLVAGNVDYTSVKQGDASSTSFGLSPKVGYQFTKNLTAGLTCSINDKKDDSGNKDNLTQYGAFLRYSMPLGSLFSAYADLGAGVQNEKFTPSGGSTAKADGFYTGLTPNVAINLKNSFCLNFSIGGLSFNSVTANTSGAKPMDTFNVNFGQSLSIGLSKNF